MTGSSSIASTQIAEWASTILDSQKPWRERKKAAEKIGGLAKGLRKKRALETLMKELGRFPGFADELLTIATDLDLPEPLRRAAAWAISQINDWPGYFNERVLDDIKLESHTTIDSSLAFLPELGYAREIPIDEQLQLAKRFLPHLDGRGFELRWDTKNFHVGPFFRILQHADDDTRRCIQYIYVWSSQSWPISGFFSFYFWPLLSFLSIIPWIVRESALAFAAEVLLAVFLTAIGIYRTLHPHEMRCFKNDSWYIGGGVLLFLSLSFLPWGALIPLAAAIAVFVLRRHVLGEIEHAMDYGPVFIYLRKRDEEWRMERARIDKFHYETAEIGKRDLEHHLSGDTLFIETDNTWRSFKFAKSHGRHSVWAYHAYVACWAILYLVTTALVGVSVLGRISTFFSSLPTLDGVWLLSWSLPAALILVVLNERAITSISDTTNAAFQNSRFFEDSEKRVLEKHKLVHLWNMMDEKANLVIRKKLQNSFRTSNDKSFWKSFRDPSAESLAYEGISRARHLETHIAKSTLDEGSSQSDSENTGSRDVF
jgi:hypothetical protein